MNRCSNSVVVLLAHIIVTYLISLALSQEFSDDIDHCSGQFRYFAENPDDSFSYDANWVVNVEEESLKISIIIENQLTNAWTAIGFSSNGTMLYSDILLYNPVAKEFFDMHSSDRRELTIDAEQNLLSSTHSKIGNISTYVFVRKLDTGDVAEDVSLQQCVHFLFPVHAGLVCENTNTLGPHFQTPVISDRICLYLCNATTSAVSNPSPSVVSQGCSGYDEQRCFVTTLVLLLVIRSV